MMDDVCVLVRNREMKRRYPILYHDQLGQYYGEIPPHLLAPPPPISHSSSDHQEEEDEEDQSEDMVLLFFFFTQLLNNPHFLSPIKMIHVV